MNSLTPWMKDGTPDVVTVMVGAPPGPTAAPPATPKSDPSSCPRSGISCGCASPALPSACPWLPALAAGGVGPAVEKEKEAVEVWEVEEEEEEVVVEEDDEDVVGVDVVDDEDVTGWPAVKEKQRRWLNVR